MGSLRSEKNLVWIDLEMSGLDPQRDTILEIATIITDPDLDVVKEGPNLVVHQPPRVLERMDAWNRKHHRASGLADEVARSKISIKKAEEITLRFIKDYCHEKKSPLCGNAIHHDRRFLIRYMPRLDAFLHYRHIDVTTVKLLAQLWYKEEAAPKKKEAHRALDDIRESIEELRFYRKRYFITAV